MYFLFQQGKWSVRMMWRTWRLQTKTISECCNIKKWATSKCAECLLEPILVIVGIWFLFLHCFHSARFPQAKKLTENKRIQHNSAKISLLFGRFSTHSNDIFMLCVHEMCAGISCSLPNYQAHNFPSFMAVKCCRLPLEISHCVCVSSSILFYARKNVWNCNNRI